MSEQPGNAEQTQTLAQELLQDVTPYKEVSDPVKEAFFRNDLGVKYDQAKIKNILKSGLDRDESLKSLAKMNQSYLQDPAFLDNVIKKGIEAQEKKPTEPVVHFNQQEIIPPSRVEKKFTNDDAKRITELVKSCRDPHSFFSSEEAEELGNLVQKMQDFNLKDNFRTFNNNMRSSLGRQMELVKMKSVLGAKFFTNPKKREWHAGAVARSII